MEFVISQGSQQLRLPIPPSEFTMQSGNMNQTVTVVRAGEINLWGPSKLDGVTIQSFFPRVYSPYCKYSNFPSPSECVKLIDAFRNSGEVCRLIIVDSALAVDINMEVLIESFDRSMKDHTGDVYFSITLKQYRRIKLPGTASAYEPTIQRPIPAAKRPDTPTESPSKANSAGSTSATAKPGTDYVAKIGESLWDIAKDKLGSGSKWTKLLAINMDTLKDPLGVTQGMVIKIPDIKDVIKTLRS